MHQLDYSITDLAQRQALVDTILKENPNPSSKYLDILADYLISGSSSEKRAILTTNRLATINKRETSYENLVSKFENGEDGVYNLTTEDKNCLFQPKDPITDQDREEIPELAQATQAIAFWSNKLKNAEGRDRYIIKSALIDARKEQYAIRMSRKPPIHGNTNPVRVPTKPITLNGYITFDENGYCVPHGISLIDPKVVSALLCNYQYYKSHAARGSDLSYLLEELDKLIDQALANKPILKTLIEAKIQELSNVEVQERIKEKCGQTHSLEYISGLWRKKIPAIIASAAEDNYLEYYYTEVEKGKWKRCSRCGKIKLAHNKYFSRNGTSKDSYYSICKECRNKRKED